jgi:hypothetical protein
MHTNQGPTTLADDDNSTAPATVGATPDTTTTSGTPAQAPHGPRGGSTASTGSKLTKYGATLSIGFKYDMMMGGDSARFFERRKDLVEEKVFFTERPCLLKIIMESTMISQITASQSHRDYSDG